MDKRQNLEPRAQINAISKRTIKMLSIKTIYSMLKINGMGGKSQTSNARINVQLKSKQGDFISRLEAMVLPHIYCVYAMPNSRFHFAISADSYVHKRHFVNSATHES